MSQQRDPPAYQEYAANMLARFEFRSLSLSERGLLYTMRQECWVNDRLPADTQTLARVLGCPASEVAAALPALKPFFTFTEEFITCPELDSYKKYLAERREKQSGGGKKGAKTTNSQKKKGTRKNDHPTLSSTPASESSSDLEVPRRGSVESLVQPNTTQSSKKLLTGGDESNEAWIDAYNSKPCTPQQYRERKGC